jgi:hypothetical protein
MLRYLVASLHCLGSNRSLRLLSGFARVEFLRFASAADTIDRDWPRAGAGTDPT